MFTPRTVKKYTGHLAGAIYGSPVRSGTLIWKISFSAVQIKGFLESLELC